MLLARRKKLAKLLVATLITFFWPGFWTTFALAQAQKQGQQPMVGGIPIDGAVYYDADTVEIDQKDGSVSLRGNVLFLFGDSFVRCERLRYFRQSGIAIIEGKVVIYRGKERIRAEKLVVHVPDREFYAERVWLSIDPNGKSSDTDFNEKILGFSKAEVTFESLREQRESELSTQLITLRDQYASENNLYNATRDPVRKKVLARQSEDTERRYAQILGRLLRTKYQPNLFLDSLPTEERSKLIKRRETVQRFVQLNKQTAKNIAERQQYPGYIALTAESIHQRPDGKIVAKEARLTPCKCESDEIPIWGLSTSDALIEPGNYATLYGATVDVAAVPAAYVPYIKFPIKTERESGFLLPSIYTTRAGQITSIPYFQTLGPHADTTVTVDSFSTRGTRVGAELRAKVTESAKATVSGEYIRDKKRAEEFDRTAREAQIDSDFPNNIYKQDQLKEQIGKANADRWRTSGAINVPYDYRLAAKADWSFLSDNQYLSDFSVDQEAKSDLFAPAQSSFRFLSQEAAAEYYGDEFGLSVRLQRYQDLLEPNSTQTPYRSPKVEFSLFPQRILSSRFTFDQQLEMENVVRKSKLNFIDQYSKQDFTVGGPPDGSQGITLASFPDGRRTPNEPYIAGQRYWGQSRIAAPVLVSPYLLSTASVRGVSMFYQFEATGPFEKQRPRMSYVSYELVNRSALDLERSFGTNAAGEGIFLGSRVSPFVNLTYIPTVTRDANFPRYYDVFYEADNISPKQTATFGIEGNLQIGRSNYQAQNSPISRFRYEQPPAPGSLQTLRSALTENNISVDGADPMDTAGIFGTTKSSAFSLVLDSWAKRELQTYYSFVSSQEFGAPNQWPLPPFYYLSRKLEATPLSYSVSTSYNLNTRATEADVLDRLRPGDSVEKIDSWGDVIFSATADANPWIPVTTNTTLKWNSNRRSFYTGTTSVAVNFPFNLALAYSNTFENYEVGAASATATNRQFLKRSIGQSAVYTPLRWLQFTYQRKAESDSQNVPLPAPELRYESLQKISLIKLQDCLDIELTRYKKAATIERYATWAIGINLQFLGQNKSFDNLGESVNRSIQNRNANL
jgi:lipopolysaccharide assembly outer membrane protein LptD (OstA)